MRFRIGGWVLAWAVTTMVAPGQLTPFVLPWDDSTSGLTDFSALNRPVDPSLRVAADADGHFVTGGERVRFLGVNFAGDAPFMPTNQAAAVAARLAKFGVNCVRFHHLDPSWATGGGLIRYTGTSSRQLNPSQLERLHFLVARLGAKGIYANLNLLTGRELRSGDGLGSAVVGMDFKDQHILGCFHPTALALQQEFATQFLTPTNRFTGLPLAKDPAVAFVEINNENGLLQKWYDGGLDRLPAPFATQLQQRWNDWLARRHGDEPALRTAWQALDQPLGANLLRNGAFATGTTSWTLEQHSGAVASVARTLEFNGGACARLKVTKVGSAGWHVQFNQAALRLTEGQLYTVTFSARANLAGPLDVSVMMAHDPWQPLGLTDTVGLTTNWQTFTRTFVATATDANTRVNFGGIGARLTTVWLADVRVQTGGSVGQFPAGTSLAGRNLPNVRHGTDGFTGTSEARRDWLRFVIQLEQEYYDAMVGHLRTNVGYPGLIFGTIMANSPAAVQSRLDVIDAHAYWQHPVFPGTPWDPVNWTVGNVSLVNAAPGATTLAGLARQRLRGKPFTVTEYQHPSPNSYGAEGPLLLAAYGALQDWDGLWLFDYGWGNDASHGGDARPMGRIRGFFDTAQHPTKMANLLVAANLFRRADVRRAIGEVTLPLTPEVELDLLLRRAGQWSVFSASQLGLPGEHALVHRVGVEYGPQAIGLATPPAVPTRLASDTGELEWQTSVSAGLVTVDSSRTQAAIGFLADRTVSLGELVLRGLPSRLGWGTVALTLVEGTSLTAGGRFLLVATGECENTGQVWKSAAKDSLSAWGTAPTRVETLPLEVTLPVRVDRVRAWVLDERGQRRGPVELRTNPEGRAILATQPAHATLWYEIEIAAPVAASFEAWRQRHFSPEELARTEISGPEAAPAGDGVRNLLKYAFGLAPKQVATAAELPRWGVSDTGSGRTLWLDYPRRKGVADLDLLPYFSRGLPEWEAAPARLVDDVGEVERVRTEHRVPSTAPSMGLLKLDLTLRPGG